MTANDEKVLKVTSSHVHFKSLLNTVLDKDVETTVDNSRQTGSDMLYMAI